MTVWTVALLAPTLAAALQLQPALPRFSAEVRRRALPLVAKEKGPLTREPDVLVPTEQGGVLWDVLPVALLLESQSADRSADPLVGEDAGTFAWKNERWGSLRAEGGQVGRDWLTFFVAVATIMTAVIVTWVLPATGPISPLQNKPATGREGCTARQTVTSTSAEP